VVGESRGSQDGRQLFSLASSALFILLSGWHLLSRLDSTCHLTCKLSLRFWGSGLVAGVPPTSIVQGVSGCPFKCSGSSSSSVIEPHEVLQMETGVRRRCLQGNVNLDCVLYNWPYTNVIGVPRLLGC
jgi:hypothetical protein